MVDAAEVDPMHDRRIGAVERGHGLHVAGEEQAAARASPATPASWLAASATVAKRTSISGGTAMR